MLIMSILQQKLLFQREKLLQKVYFLLQKKCFKQPLIIVPLSHSHDKDLFQ